MTHREAPLIRPKQIITGHASADFDAIAAMLAAKKLYPEAELVQPTLIVRQETHPLLDGLRENFGFRPAKDYDFSEVELLVIVDSKRPDRIPQVEEVLGREGLVIHIYDHHPETPEDLTGDVEVSRPWGAATSILVSLIQEKGLTVTKDEATLLALGIYEDTGRFSFPSTTSHDLEAAAWLARFGMDYTTIADLTRGDLTRQQVHVLDELLRSAVTHNVNGVQITLLEISLDSYLGDFATIVTKLMQMESLSVVFALASMGDRVHIIARSKLEAVDVGKVCRLAFGGGGHPNAASASVRDRTLAQTKAVLVTYLLTTVASEITVRNHMTTPAITIGANALMTEAEEIMSRFGLKAAPVILEDTGECVGIVDQQTALRATSHKLGNQLAKEYMHRRFETLEPNSDMHLALDIILNKRQRLVPVMQEGHVIGVITRTDILRIMVDETLHMNEGERAFQSGVKATEVELGDLLPDKVVAILSLAGETGDTLGIAVFAVGGFVRDLILRQHNLDIDLTVEGDVEAFAEALASRIRGTVRHHHKFKTATVRYTDAEGLESHIDVATARMEYYEQPAALPSVELASLKMDLYRRDFTINAMAVHLNKNNWGQLVDPFGGQQDIRNKRIAVLHSLSLVEDPTRILRAVRFEQRYGFRINNQTERLIKNSLSLNLMDKLSGTRLFNEIRHVFEEKNALRCIERLGDWGVWKTINPKLAMNPTKRELVVSVEEVLNWYRLLYKSQVAESWQIYLMALFYNLKHDEMAPILERFVFTSKDEKAFLVEQHLIQRTSRYLIGRHKEGAVARSSLYEALSPVSLEGQLYMMARYGQQHNIGQDVSLFLTALKGISLDIGGNDLVAMGYKSGPLVGSLLHLILLAKIDGYAPLREDQILIAKNYLMHQGEPDFVKPTLESLMLAMEPATDYYQDPR